MSLVEKAKTALVSEQGLNPNLNLKTDASLTNTEARLIVDLSDLKPLTIIQKLRIALIEAKLRKGKPISETEADILALNNREAGF